MKVDGANLAAARENLGKDLAEILFVGKAELTSYPDPPEPVDSTRPDLEEEG